jgi:TP901 family phage tail tape measure protein
MAAGDTIAKLFVELGFKGTALTEGSRQAQRDFNRIEKGAAKLSNTISKTLVASFKAASLAMAAFGTTAAITGAKFEKAMVTVGILSGETGRNLQALTAFARELGATTAYTATEAAEGMQALARAGLDANEIIFATGPALDFAGANATDMNQATMMLASTMAQFNLHALDSERIVDTYTAAINNSLLDTTSLAEAMKYAGTMGKAFGLSLEDTTAAVAMFRNLGLEGSQAGTNFRMAMIQASRATDRKRQVLEKYGLTMADINPELHSFADIMRTVGTSAMGTTDAIEIFGARSGANVAMLSAEITNNSERWQQVNAAIADSAGLTARNYETQMNTVIGQWDILRSVMQDLQIELFEGFGEGLTELLRSLQEVIKFTMAYMVEGTSAIASRWNDTMLGMADSMVQNKASIAATIVNIVQAFTTLGQKVLWLIDNFRTLARLLLSMWVVTKLYAFLGAINAITGATIAATGATAGLSVAINSLTAGVPALIGVVTAGVSAFLMMGSSADTAEESAHRLQRRHEALREAIERGVNARVQNLDAEAQAHNEALHAIEMRLLASEGLTNVISREIESVRDMTAADREAAIASGELVGVIVEGEQALVSTAMAYRLANTDGSQWQSEMQSALYMTNSLLSASTTATYNNVDAIDTNRQAGYDAAEERLQQITVELDSLSLSRGRYAELHTERIRLIDEEARLHSEYAEERDIALHDEQQAEEAHTGFLQTQEATRLQMEREAATRNISLTADETEEREKLYEKLQKARLAAEKKTNDLLRKSIIALAKAEGRLADNFEMILEDRLEKIEQAFREEQALWAGHADRVAAIEGRLQRTLANNRRTAMLTERSNIESMTSDRNQAANEMFMSEMEILRERHREEVEEARVHARNMSRAYAEGTTERANAITEGIIALAELEEAQEAERAATVRKTRLDFTRELAQEEIGIRRGYLPEFEQIEQEIAQRNMQARSQGLADVTALESLNAEMRLAIRRDLSDEVTNLIRQEASEEVRLTAERDALLARLPQDMVEERLAVMEFYAKKIAELNEDEVKGLGKLKKAWGGATKAIKTGLDVLSSAYGSLKGLFASVLDQLAALTGFAFSLIDAVREVNEVMQERRDIEAQHDAGEITSAEYMEAIKGLPTSTAEASSKLVASMINGAIAMVETFVSAAPQILLALRLGIPRLLKVVVDALPQILKSVISMIKPIVKAFAGFIPELIQILAEAIPSLVRRLAGSLTIIVKEIVNALPSVINAIVKLIPMIVTALTQVITMLIRGLPELITALIKFIPVLVTAVIENLPVIIQAIIQELPAIVMALMRGILESVPKIVEAVLKMLWAFFRDLITEIVTLGMGNTATFGDTPGVIQAGNAGMTAGFAGGDYIVAAQRKEDLLKQVVASMTGGLSATASRMKGAALDLPAISGIGSAVMQAADSFSSSTTGSESQPLRVTVTAEGKTLDDVLYIAGTRGKTPQLQKSLRKASGATLGFSRGRFASSS